jgi:hypothetical protein
VDRSLRLPAYCIVIPFVAMILFSGTGCNQKDQESAEPRPHCTGRDSECGDGWHCAESDTLEWCTTSIVCEGSRYTCIAEGIFEAGRSCLANSECVEGAHCSRIEAEARQVCRLDECMRDSECSEGEMCRNFDCITTLGASCSDQSGEYGCSDHEICSEGECVAAPPEGGNSCWNDSDCAPDAPCTYGTGVPLCATCADDEQCTDPEASYCHEGHCGICNASSCAPRHCDERQGCVECLQDEHCQPGGRCVNGACNASCDQQEECGSGLCQWEG